jgi:hypothetical protein
VPKERSLQPPLREHQIIKKGKDRRKKNRKVMWKTRKEAKDDRENNICRNKGQRRTDNNKRGITRKIIIH